MLTLKIAWRSLLRHKAKSFVIGVILFLGAFIMTLGDATAIGMRRGIEENLVKSFAGNVVLVSNEETKDKMSFMMTFGCNFDDFQRVFGNPIKPVEGHLLYNGETGIMLNVQGRQDQYKSQGYWLVPEGTQLDKANLSDEAKKETDLETRSSLALEGFGEVNSTNKDVPVAGIMRFKGMNTIFEQFTIMDIETFRELFGYYTAEDVVQTLPPRENALLSASDDSLFSGGDIYSSGKTASDVRQVEKEIQAPARVTRKINFDEAAYNYVSVVLKPGVSTDSAVARLKQVMKDNDLPVKVLSWKQASGEVASTADVLQTIITVFVVLLFFMAIIIIMNTLSMNALERTEEFGMMRAVGAQKNFVTRMFLAETFSLSAAFGCGGILAGAIGTWVVRALHIGSAGNRIFELIFGGEVFRPALGIGGLVAGIIGLALVTVLAVMYPVRVARRITPLDAINRH